MIDNICDDARELEDFSGLYVGKPLYECRINGLNNGICPDPKSDGCFAKGLFEGTTYNPKDDYVR